MRRLAGALVDYAIPFAIGFLAALVWLDRLYGGRGPRIEAGRRP